MQVRTSETPKARAVFATRSHPCNHKCPCSASVILQHRAVDHLAESASLADAAPRILKDIAEAVKWELGELWIVDAGTKRLRHFAAWHKPSARLSAFVRFSRKHFLNVGEGLPGTVWAKKKPLSTSQLANERRFLRKRLAAIAGLRAAFGFPVCIGSEVVGVMMFFSLNTRTLDGEWLPVLASLGSGLGRFIRCKQIEDTLRENETRLRLLVQTAGTVIVGLDKGGTILEWNREAERIYGYKSAEVIGQNYLTRFLPQQHRRGVERELRKVWRGGVSRAYENPVLSRTGRTRTLLWNASLLRNGDGRPLAIIGIGQDITPLKAAQEELFQSEAELRALLENSPDIIARVDPSLRYAYVNRAITGEFGHTLRAACELGLPVEVARALDQKCRAVFSSRQGQRLEFTLRFSDGERQFVTRIVPEFGKGGKVTSALAITSDVTERKRLEKEVLAATEREQRRIGNDLHDGLGQQLTAIGLSLHGLATEVEERAPGLAGQARQLCTEFQKAVAQTRLLSHGLSPVSLEADGLMNALRELAEGSRTLSELDCQFHCPSPVMFAQTDKASHLYRIAQEAVNNALKHAGGTGVRIALSSSAREIALSIEDNGCGFDPAAPAHSGIGLHIMNYRASLIGASLSVNSVSGTGTRVICRLPQAS